MRIGAAFVGLVIISVIARVLVRVVSACALVCACLAQFKTNVPLVFTPTTITDSKGHYVDGVAAEDLILCDNNVPQAIQVDWNPLPISLVVAVETNANSGPLSISWAAQGFCLTNYSREMPEKRR